MGALARVPRYSVLILCGPRVILAYLWVVLSTPDQNDSGEPKGTYKSTSNKLNHYDSGISPSPTNPMEANTVHRGAPTLTANRRLGRTILEGGGVAALHQDRVRMQWELVVSAEAGDTHSIDWCGADGIIGMVGILTGMRVCGWVD
jgi:hypothetical protein